MRRPVLLIVILSLVATACGAGVASGVVADDPTAAVDGADRAAVLDAIAVPLSLYVVIDAEDGRAAPLSSIRTEAELETITEGVDAIWSQAGVVFDPVEVRTVEVPGSVLSDLADGDARSFFDGAGRQFEVPGPSVINGFYVAAAAGVNGFTAQGTGVFFVVDRPTVHDERVTSHEIGHILGLRHTLDDVERLMFPGSNGMALTSSELDIARAGATGLLDATRQSDRGARRGGAHGRRLLIRILDERRGRRGCGHRSRRRQPDPRRQPGRLARGPHAPGIRGDGHRALRG